jgi:hypothetical protein
VAGGDPARCQGHGRGKPLPANRSGRRILRAGGSGLVKKRRGGGCCAVAAGLEDVWLAEIEGAGGEVCSTFPRHPPNPHLLDENCRRIGDHTESNGDKSWYSTY